MSLLCVNLWHIDYIAPEKGDAAACTCLCFGTGSCPTGGDQDGVFDNEV